jgi:hypothetical protein
VLAWVQSPGPQNRQTDKNTNKNNSKIQKDREYKGQRLGMNNRSLKKLKSKPC